MFFLHKVLLVRGTARLEPVNGVVPEYAIAAERFRTRTRTSLGREPRKNDLLHRSRNHKPEWVGLLDFQTRFPSALPL